MIASVTVSLRPPLSLIITAHPLLDASKLDLPNGSFHLEQATDIETSSSFFKMYLCSLNPKLIYLGCLKRSFSLGSSPKT